jgi:hypothetical protein
MFFNNLEGSDQIGPVVVSVDQIRHRRNFALQILSHFAALESALLGDSVALKRKKTKTKNNFSHFVIM